MAQTQALEPAGPAASGEAEGQVQGPAAALDCTRCGACCVVAGDVPVEYGENGNAELTPKKYTWSAKNHPGFTSWEWEFGTRVMKRLDLDNRCIALAGKVGHCVSCKIYEKRPKVCRQFEAGSQGCLDARARVSME